MIIVIIIDIYFDYLTIIFFFINHNGLMDAKAIGLDNRKSKNMYLETEVTWDSLKLKTDA